MDNISKILYKRLTGNISPEEQAILDEWISKSEANRQAAQRLADIERLEREYHLRGMVNTRRPAEEMNRRISSLSDNRRKFSLRYAAAAAVAAIMIGFSAYWISNIADMSAGPDNTVAETRGISDFNDIKPGTVKALLTNEAGKTVALDQSAEAGVTTATYFGTGTSTIDRIEELKLEIPRGHEFKIVLEDSTVVWLNSESVLRYPESFGSDERRVEVSGEAYFDVKHDESRPFYVMSGGQQIRVYGTTFNVRDYSDDPTIYTTLESGSIALTHTGERGGELMLSPGHQAVFDKADSQVALRTVNTKVITGWRHGRFVFEEQPLSQIMRDLSRWYDFEYEFTGDGAENVVFKGSIPRYSDFKTAIKILETSGGITFSIENNKIKIALSQQAT